MLLEVIACSLEDALEAERGGAGRIELVRALDRGGLTPPHALVEEVVGAVAIPVRVMIREADGFAAGGEVARLAELAHELSLLPVDGLVTGFLREGEVDEEAMDAITTAAPGARVTFHHAFDALGDPVRALERLRRWPRIDRILTAGRGADWRAKAAAIASWERASAPAITMLAGGGVDQDAMRILARAGVREAHAGRAARVPPVAAGRVAAARVAALVAAARQ